MIAFLRKRGLTRIPIRMGLLIRSEGLNAKEERPDSNLTVKEFQWIRSIPTGK